jgi:hypothetical protein
MAGKLEIFSEPPSSFFLRIVDASIRFEFAMDGKAVAVTLHQNGRNMPAKRVP